MSSVFEDQYSIYRNRRSSYKQIKANRRLVSRVVSCDLPVRVDSILLIETISMERTRPRNVSFNAVLCRQEDESDREFVSNFRVYCNIEYESGTETVNVVDKYLALSLNDERSILLADVREKNFFVRRTRKGIPKSWSINLLWDTKSATGSSADARGVRMDMIVSCYYDTEETLLSLQALERTRTEALSVRRKRYMPDYEPKTKKLKKKSRRSKFLYETEWVHLKYVVPPGQKLSERIDISGGLVKVYRMNAEVCMHGEGDLGLDVYRYSLKDPPPGENRVERNIISIRQINLTEGQNTYYPQKAKTTDLNMISGDDIFYLYCNNGSSKSASVNISYRKRTKLDEQDKRERSYFL